MEFLFKGNWEEYQPDDALESLEKAIHSHFITGQSPPGEHMQEMLALPARLGGLGLTNPATSAKEQAASQQISAPLVDRIVNQDHQPGSCHSFQQSIKGESSTLNAQNRKMPKNYITIYQPLSNVPRNSQKRVPPPG